MWRKLLNICSSYRLFLEFYAMNVSLLPQFPVSIYDLKKSPSMSAATLWLSSETFLLPYEVHATAIFILKYFSIVVDLTPPPLYQPFIYQAMITLLGYISLFHICFDISYYAIDLF